MRSKPENIVFHWKINILIRIGAGDELYFYETNPNEKHQDARLQYVVKKPDGEKNKTNPNKEIETGNTLHGRQFHPRPRSRNQFTKRFGCPTRSDPIRLNPAGSDPIRVRLPNPAKTGMRPIRATPVH